jgi:hypothetical protein
VAVADITHGEGRLQSSWNGRGYYAIPAGVGEGTHTHRLNMGCMQGPAQFVVSLEGHPDCETAVKSSTFAPAPTTTQYTPKITPVADFTFVNLSWRVANSFANNRVIATYVHESGSDVILDTTTGMDGARTLSGTRGSGIVFVEGQSCTGEPSSTQIPIGNSCNSPGADSACNECFGTPIHAVSGNMRAEEEDPIAGFGDIIPFRRYYDSYSTREISTLNPVRRGAFGSRWDRSSVHRRSGRILLWGRRSSI